MKIAYLIEAHTDPQQLKRLIGAIKTPYTKFFIHVDGKTDIQPFYDLIQDDQVLFLTKRTKVYWGGYSQVIATTSLLKMVFDSKEHFERIVMISGQDYPIYSNQQIIDTFRANPDKQILKGYNITQGNFEPQMIKLKKFYFFDPPGNMFRRRIKSFLQRKKLKRSLQVFFNWKYNDVFFGSDWWALTYDCAEYIYKTYKKSWIFRRYMEYCFAPSELFLHTIVFNSAKYAKHIEYCLPDEIKNGLESVTPLQYIDYRDGMRVLDENDFDTLINSGKMFLRKAATGKSDKLMDMLDNYRDDTIKK